LLIGELENIKSEEVLLASIRKVSNVHQFLVAKFLGSGLLENRWQKMKIKTQLRWW
jgi:hypothetical protein